MATDKIELTAKRLQNLKPAPPGARYEIADTHVGGLRVRVGDEADARGKAAQLTFVLLARFPPSTNPTRRALGSFPTLQLADARQKAIGWKELIKGGVDPARDLERERAEAEREAVAVARQAKTFSVVADLFLQRHVHKQKLRTAPEITRQLNNYVRPVWGDRPFLDIRRSDVTDLLDDIEDRNGQVMADRVLATLSKMFNWWASREDNYSSPIVRGMGRSNGRDRARKRILDDDELRALWSATEGSDTFGAFVRVLLLTGQRRAKVAAMRWQDVSEDGVWTIQAEAREKPNAGSLKLSDAALEIINGQKRRTDNPHVFAGRLKGPINGFSKLKRGLDERSGIEPWVLHDLRRTAKSLMARAGVRPDVSERVLGHVIAGVEGVYDRHSYFDEKKDASERLAGLLRSIVEDRGSSNVVALRSSAECS